MDIPEQKFDVGRACFPKEEHQNSQKWAKFMNYSFWPFLWFGLPGRLLTVKRAFEIYYLKSGLRYWDEAEIGISNHLL